MAHPVFSKNIAVMPFENITKDTEKNWIGAGFAETLTTKLCKVKEINLLEREQLSKILDEIKFQKSDLVDENTAVQTGKMHGVDVMVFGSYQIMGDILRVNARFVNVETRKVIDSVETTGNMPDIFKLQDDIAFSSMFMQKQETNEKIGFNCFQILKKEQASLFIHGVLKAYTNMYRIFDIFIKEKLEVIDLIWENTWNQVVMHFAQEIGAK